MTRDNRSVRLLGRQWGILALLYKCMDTQRCNPYFLKNRTPGSENPKCDREVRARTWAKQAHGGNSSQSKVAIFSVDEAHLPAG
jgi:hypothetical protein